MNKKPTDKVIIRRHRYYYEGTFAPKIEYWEGWTWLPDYDRAAILTRGEAEKLVHDLTSGDTWLDYGEYASPDYTIIRRSADN